ncbi:hypothetical protein PIROE2DRAFT_9748 [Piromyces sp. E2]|nr:hypothetical protein PIROE2DRAFT_9748 [Piromyces sp. E2]|eukprot:OUM63676.1 hypothetical protein PIROE2DRAFT_9748 [Piromyces sp. E2]
MKNGKRLKKNGQADKKNIAVKSLVHDVETLHAEQLKKRDNNATYQYSLSFKDATIFGDMKKIIRCYLRHCHTFNESDIKRIIKFLNEFIPKFFHIKNIEDDDDYEDDDEDDVDEEEEEKIETTDESHSTETITENDLSDSKNESINKNSNDLRKKILIKSHENNKMELDNISSTNSTISVLDSGDNENETVDSVFSSVDTQKSKVKLDNAALKIRTCRPIFLLFGNNAFYCFFRLYHKLYERLLNLKNASERMAKEPDQLDLLNPIAVELGFIKKETFL